MGDNISRQAALAYPLSWEHYDKEHGDWKFICGVESYREYIEHLPSVDEWIPCSERLPDKDGEYIVTQKNGSIGRYVFSCEGNSEEYFKRCAIAWMPLPEPYKGGE